jgi:hypothetical protein
LTHNTDVDITIILSLNLEDLKNVCASNKLLYNFYHTKFNNVNYKLTSYVDKLKSLNLKINTQHCIQTH